MALRVLVVCQYFWPERFRINDIAAQLVARGHQVTVLCGTPNYPTGRFFDGFGWFKRAREVWRGVTVIRVPIVPRGKGGKLGLALNYVSFLISATLFGPFVCRSDYDLVLVYQLSPVTMGIPGLLMSVGRGIPMVFWVQDLWPESIIATGATRNKFALSIAEWLVRLLYRRSTLILIQSKAFRDHIERRQVRGTKIHYLPNSAESIYKPMSAADAHEALSAIPSGTRILFAGNVGVAQDFGTILDAAESTRHDQSIIWLVAGEGRMLGWVKEEIKRRSLEKNLILLGQFPVSDMPRLFAGVDGLLVTLRDEPIFALTIPSKVQSYLACGKPIIAALNGEGADMIKEAGAGICVPAENPAELAAAAETLSRMPTAARAAMGKSAFDYFDNHLRIDRHIDQLEKLLIKAAEKSRTKERAPE